MLWNHFRRKLEEHCKDKGFLWAKAVVLHGQAALLLVLFQENKPSLSMCCELHSRVFDTGITVLAWNILLKGWSCTKTYLVDVLTHQLLVLICYSLDQLYVRRTTGNQSHFCVEAFVNLPSDSQDSFCSWNLWLHDCEDKQKLLFFIRCTQIQESKADAFW